MKPPPFDYHDPETLETALELVAELGDGASILAGGQSLVPLLNLRLARPAALVDLRRVPGLDFIEVTGESIRVGAMTRAAALEANADAIRALPCLGEALGNIGHLQIRNRTTIGGNIAHADPASELPAVLLALEGTVTLRSAARGERTVPAGDFFYSVFWTTREPDEIVTEVAFPLFPGPSTFVEVARRPGDFALVGACIALSLADGTVADARIAFSGAGDRPVRAAEAEDVLRRNGRSPESVAQATLMASRGLSPPSDIHGSGEYRAALAETLVRRGLGRLLEGQ